MIGVGAGGPTLFGFAYAGAAKMITTVAKHNTLRTLFLMARRYVDVGLRPLSRALNDMLRA